MNDERKILNDSLENTCVVCFKNVEIYSIGECDHPVCYECSTRMRVLCQQNECPICRQGLSKVIFTKEKRSYRDLEASNRSEYYNKKYRICFSDTRIQKAFYDLLEHPCPKCNFQPFRSFDALKDHVRKEHELFYCDICTKHLKIFSFEQKCYNRQDLGMHRRKGDPDNKSHRGHPNCQYCDCRYLDRDELFRHLRREHYFCHFCDADGANQFYADYNSLRQHFRADHFICEEGDCAGEEFTAVFRSDIDLRAHIASVHGKTMGKLQAKQARTLQLEITLGPRIRPNQPDQNIANLSQRTNDEQYEFDTIHSSSYLQHMPRVIDAKDEQEFPSLKRGASTSSGVTLIRPTMSIHTKTYGPAGLARTKENFPALGGGSPDTGSNLSSNSKCSQPPVSAIIKNNQQPKTSSGNSMVIHVSNRPNTSASNVNNIGTSGSIQKFSKDFPALPGNSRKQMINLQEDFVPLDSNINLNPMSAKYRSLVDNYVAVAQPNAVQKLTVVPKENSKTANTKSTEQKLSFPKFTNTEFPALTISNTAVPEIIWVKSKTKKEEKENPKSKETPISNGLFSLQKYEKKDIVSSDIKYNKRDKRNNKQTNEKKQNDVKKTENNSNTVKNIQTKQSNNKQNSKEKKSENNNDNKQLNKNSNKIKEKTVEKTSETEKLNKKHFPKLENSIPPPGFDLKRNGTNKPPPPGFKSVTLNSVAKPSNNLTFTNSLGEIYSIVPNYQYLPPPNSVKRNQELVTHFQTTLKYPEAVEEFRHISQKFREGLYRALPFYDHCQAALKDKFDEIFPELLVLLPDISKQQELYLVHSQYLKQLSSSNNKLQENHANLEVCSTCKQVLLQDDMKSHTESHTLENNFPSLHGNGESIVSSNYKK